MNTRKILTMSLFAVLCGCQPETPAQASSPAETPVTATQLSQQRTSDATKVPGHQAVPITNPEPSASVLLAAAEQVAAAPPAQKTPAQPEPIAPQGSESGTMLKADDIKTEPFRDAKTVATLASGDKVSILNKDGGWYQVKSTKGTGWVRMLSIRKGEAAKGGTSASGLLALGSGRAGTGKVVATTGIRGLNEEELKAAKFSEEEVKRAESYATDKQAAAKFAAAGKLVARKFDYLPAPK